MSRYKILLLFNIQDEKTGNDLAIGQSCSFNSRIIPAEVKFCSEIYHWVNNFNYQSHFLYFLQEAADFTAEIGFKNISHTLKKLSI